MSSNTFQEVWETIKNKKTWSGLITNLKKDGRSYIVDSTIVPILDIDGDIVEFIAIRNDVTDFEQAKEQLSNLNKAMKHKVDELYSMAQTLEQQASIDVLTGIFNRMKFEEFFEFELQKAKMQRTQLSIILLDIDDFKNVNDTYGHDVGDFVLKELCQVVDNKLRKGDVFARYGGEEFIIIFPNSTIQAAISIANRIRKDIESHDFKKVPQVTVSLGVIEVKENTLVEIFLKNVDIALYKAKENGRNNVVVFEEIIS